jgi:uncharacterized protein YwqG
MSDNPLHGNALLEMVARLSHMPRTQIAIQCGYYTLIATEDGQLFRQADLTAFYNAVLAAKQVSNARIEKAREPQMKIAHTSKNLDLPSGLEQFRSRLEATVKPYVEIKTHLTREVSLWQSKMLGFPYLPKNFDYPRTPEGDYLYLLAQINFEEVPQIEGFPEQGILQFYISRGPLYGCDLYNLSNQESFRVVYFPNPDFSTENLITDFDFLPTLWNFEDSIPFYVFPSYTPHREDCFALSFTSKFAPISDCDPKFEELIGSEIWNVLEENNYALLDEYRKRFVVGHRLNGYPYFTQDGPRELLTEKEPYILLLQIDSDSSASEKIYIEWGDMGVCNFWIKESALKMLDFSKVLYYWDCS